MKYLSIDLEATGLRENDLIIEFAMVPFDTKTLSVEEDLAKHWYIACPSFESLKPNLDKWVIDHNKGLIERAHKEGLSLADFKKEMLAYLTSSQVKAYFEILPTEKDRRPAKITLFGKSMNAIDLPFLSRDLGWEFMREHFSHRTLDLSSAAQALVDFKVLPISSPSGTELMNYVGLGEVKHTALADAINTALIYIKLLEKSRSISQ